MMRREKALCGHAADQGEESSFRLLADLYRNGYYGVPVDLQKQLGGMISANLVLTHFRWGKFYAQAWLYRFYER